MIKSEFIQMYKDGWGDVHAPTMLVVAVVLPDSKVELIINSQGNLEEKFNYYLEAYDDGMCLKVNPKIRIKDIMLV